MSIWDYANPKKFMQTSAWALPWAIGATVLCLCVGLVWGFFFTPDDYKQGSDGEDHLPACAGRHDGDQCLGDDAGHKPDLDHPAPPCQRAGRKGGGPRSG